MKRIILLILPFITLSCDNKVERQPLSNFGDLKNPVLLHSDTVDLKHTSKVVAIAANQDYLYVLGEDSSAIYRYSHDLQLISTHLLHGRGPGELLKPDMIAVSHNRVCVVDDDDNSVQIYDTSLVHLESFSMNSIVNSLDVVGADFFLVSFVELDQSRIELYDAKLLKTFTIEGSSNHPLDIIGFANFLDKDVFYFVRRYTNEGYLVNIKTNELTKFNNPFMMEKVETEKKMNILVPNYQITLQSASTEKGLFSLAGVILEEGLPLFKYNALGEIEDVWVFDESLQIQRMTITNDTLFGYSYINNTLSKYEL